VDENMQFQVVQ